MKQGKTYMLAAVVVSMSGSGLAQDLPQAATFARYQPMMERSPFAVATAVVPPPAAPTFAKELFVANAAKLEDESVVTLHSSADKNVKEYLSTKGPNENGYMIESIEWSDRVGATRVTISKDGQTATLTFNQALLTQPIGSAPAVPGVTQVPQPVQQNYNPAINSAVPNQTVIAPAPVPMLPTPPPRTRGVIQRNPAVPQVQPQVQPQQQQQQQNAEVPETE